MDTDIKKRIYSIDLLRGLIMIIMALDHSRDFFHADAFVHDPLDLNTTSFILYFTRWITHFCAPLFVFLSGLSIYLQSQRKSKSDLSLFLLKRGLWLIFLEFVLMTFLWHFDFSFSMIFLQVIWTFGICMIFMAGITRLPLSIIFIGGFLLVAGHNIFDFVDSTHKGFFWDLIRNGSFAMHAIDANHLLVIIYPFVPWLGVMMLGYCLGKIFTVDFDSIKRKKILIRLGTGLIFFFILLRWTNLYGDPIPWTNQKNVLYTLLSFLNTDKYPPSLLYLCMTIGPGLLFLAFFEKANNRLTNIISVYGKVPFFYYIIHFYLLHISSAILFFIRGHTWNEIPGPNASPFAFLNNGEGYSLAIVYLVWSLLVIALYPYCKWFSDYKTRHTNWWLSYL